MQQQMPPADQIPTVFRRKIWVLELFSFISFPLQSELTFVLFFVFSLLLLQTKVSKALKESAFNPHRANSRAVSTI